MSPLSDGRTLRVSWSPPRGHWENYSILLRDGSVVLQNQTISKLSRQHTFSVLSLGLVPGRLYGAEVTVHSGTLGNTALCHGRLGQLTFTPARELTPELSLGCLTSDLLTFGTSERKTIKHKLFLNTKIK